MNFDYSRGVFPTSNHNNNSLEGALEGELNFPENGRLDHTETPLIQGDQEIFSRNPPINPVTSPNLGNTRLYQGASFASFPLLALASPSNEFAVAWSNIQHTPSSRWPDSWQSMVDEINQDRQIADQLEKYRNIIIKNPSNSVFINLARMAGVIHNLVFLTRIDGKKFTHPDTGTQLKAFAQYRLRLLSTGSSLFTDDSAKLLFKPSKRTGARYDQFENLVWLNPEKVTVGDMMEIKFMRRLSEEIDHARQDAAKLGQPSQRSERRGMNAMALGELESDAKFTTAFFIYTVAKGQKALKIMDNSDLPNPPTNIDQAMDIAVADETRSYQAWFEAVERNAPEEELGNLVNQAKKATAYLYQLATLAERITPGYISRKQLWAYSKQPNAITIAKQEAMRLLESGEDKLSDSYPFDIELINKIRDTLAIWIILYQRQNSTRALPQEVFELLRRHSYINLFETIFNGLPGFENSVPLGTLDPTKFGFTDKNSDKPLPALPASASLSIKPNRPFYAFAELTPFTPLGGMMGLGAMHTLKSWRPGDRLAVEVGLRYQHSLKADPAADQEALESSFGGNAALRYNLRVLNKGPVSMYFSPQIGVYKDFLDENDIDLGLPMHLGVGMNFVDLIEIEAKAGGDPFGSQPFNLRFTARYRF